MTIAPISKPASSGVGKTALAVIQSSIVNIRSGPGTQYNDIGDILNGTLLVYYPGSRTSTGWIWVEQNGAAGWVATNVIAFQDVPVYQVQNKIITPYDGKSAVWHWKGQGISERTIDELAINLKRNAPNVKQVWVKIGDGNAWQGQFDKSTMAITGTQSIDKWVQTLQRYGLEFHAWIVLKGADIDGEARLIGQACTRPGVKSLILDIEPYEYYWQGGREQIRPLMLRVRRLVGGGFHIGMSVDPRENHYARIFPEEWFPFVNSIHPMCYWKSFRRSVDDVLEETYRVWGSYGRPIIPILQGDAPLEEQLQAHTIATRRYGAKGLSWWRYGVVDQWGGANTPIASSGLTTPVEQTLPGVVYGAEQILKPGVAGFKSGTYTGAQEFQTFEGTWGWQVSYKSTETQTAKVWAEWKANLTESGVYQISVFVPARHATARQARYKIHGVRGTTSEVIVDINQAVHRNEWVPLGLFDLVKETPKAGKVFLNDVTGETGKEIAFDAIRIRRLIAIPAQSAPKPQPSVTTTPEVVNGIFVVDGFDAPIGTAEQRRGSRVWPTGWLDASPYGRLYFVGTPREAYHTSSDLNFGAPYEDLGMPVYAAASGVVTFAAKLPVWGNVTILRHDPLKTPTGRIFYTRYGHVQNMRVGVGQRVKRGQQLAEIGDAFGTYVPHLHFDVSPTSRLESRPDDWPGRDFSGIRRDYIDPSTFIQENRP